MLILLKHVAFNNFKIMLFGYRIHNFPIKIHFFVVNGQSIYVYQTLCSVIRVVDGGRVIPWVQLKNNYMSLGSQYIKTYIVLII